MKYALVAVAALLAGCGSRTPAPASTPVTDHAAVPYDCVASITDLSTGKEWEIPAPCHDPDNGICLRVEGSGTVFRAWAEPCTPAELFGCVGAATVRITDSGPVTECVPDSGNPSVQS